MALRLCLFLLPDDRRRHCAIGARGAAGGSWIAQRFVEQAPLPTPWGPRFVTLGAYVLDGRFRGYYARITPHSHVSHDALVVPVFVAPDDAGAEHELTGVRPQDLRDGPGGGAHQLDRQGGLGDHVLEEPQDLLGLPLVVLRFFSVYGPRQRPDMGYYRFIDAMLNDEPITVHGDGLQVRGNTYIDDCINATVMALDAPLGETYNLGGSETASVWDILHKLEAILGQRPVIHRKPARLGDQRSTYADTSKLRRHLGWQARTTLDDGLERQVAWQKSVSFRSLTAVAKAWSASAAVLH